MSKPLALTQAVLAGSALFAATDSALKRPLVPDNGSIVTEDASPS